MPTGTPLIRPPRFKPKRDRQVDVLGVPCPSCGAGVDVKCSKLDGTPGNPMLRHDSRRRMAVRADNLARGI